MEAQDEWSHRECQAGCRALRGNLRLSIGLAERQDRVEDEGRARYQCSEPGAYPHPPSADRLEPQVLHCR